MVGDRDTEDSYWSMRESEHELPYGSQHHELQHQMQHEVQPELQPESQHNVPQDAHLEIKKEIKTEQSDQTSDSCFPPEFVQKQLQLKSQSDWRTPEAVFEQLMIDKPWENDDEECDETLVPAPKSNLRKPKPGEKNPRQCWLRLGRSWLKKNFMHHMVAAGNIRFKGTTFSSLCHHPTTPWDCHPLCWQCYKDFELPLCGYAEKIDCKFCRMMGVTATQARVEKMKLKQYERRNYAAKTALPASVYTQADADQWLEAKNIHQLPNPDWLLENQPVGNCFPAQLITPGQSVTDAVRLNKKWKKASFVQDVKMHNNVDRPRRLVNKTISQMKGVFVPKCCIWEEHVECEKIQETVQQTDESWATKDWAIKLTAELEKTCKAMEAMTQRLCSGTTSDAISHAEESSTDFTVELLQNMTPDKMRRVILSQQDIIRQLQQEKRKEITSAPRSRASSFGSKEMMEKILKDAENFLEASM